MPTYPVVVSGWKVQMPASTASSEQQGHGRSQAKVAGLIHAQGRLPWGLLGVPTTRGSRPDPTRHVSLFRKKASEEPNAFKLYLRPSVETLVTTSRPSEYPRGTLISIPGAPRDER